MYLFTVGTKMTFRAAPKMLLRGLGIMSAKVGVATLFALIVAKFFGGYVLGLSTLAIMVAMSDTNGGMFLALTSVMGDKEDAGTYVVQSIETGTVPDDGDLCGRRAGEDSLYGHGVGGSTDHRGCHPGQPR